MSNAVLIIVTIPEKEFEKTIKEKKFDADKSLNLKKVIRNPILINDKPLHTISESQNESILGNVDLDNENEDQKELSLETILEEALEFLGIFDATWSRTKNKKYLQVYFPCELEESDQVIQYLSSHGIGSKIGTSIGMIPFSLYYREEILNNLKENTINSLDKVNNRHELKRELSGLKAAQSKFLKSVTSRLTVAQVVDNVRSNAELTFDFICYLILASWIAAMGLVDNSVVSLVASMLVSPMMGPVIAITFGATIKDRSLRSMGFRNLGVCFAICILFGYIFGLIVFNFTKYWADQNWPTGEMVSRGLPRVCWVGTLVALPSGAAVAISLLAGNQSSLVGVAISVSLLPPAVNSGLLWAFATIKSIYAMSEPYIRTRYPKINKEYFLPPSLTPQETYKPFYNDNLAIESSLLGVFSLCLSLVNITGIIIAAFILLKIKEVVPLSAMAPSTRRFFKEDLRIFREYNTMSRGKPDEIGREVLQEWAEIAGIDPEELLSQSPEARVTQIQTLADIVRDVEADEVFQNVKRNTTNADDLVRRISRTIYNQQANIGTLKNNSNQSVHLTIADLEPGQASRRKASASNASEGIGSKSSRRSSRVSQIIANILPGMRRNDQEESSGFASKDTLQVPSSPMLRPHSTGVLPTSQVFEPSSEAVPLKEMRKPSLNENLRERKRSNALRRSLQTSEHSPFSVWPSARPSSSPRFIVTPVNESQELAEETQNVDEDTSDSNANNYKN